MTTTALCVVVCGLACGGLEGVVVDEAWQPVPGAAVLLLRSPRGGWSDEVLARTASGEDGAFAFEDQDESHLTGSSGVWVLHPEKGFASCRLGHGPSPFVTVQLAPLESYSLRVIDEEGKPVPDADVFLCGGDSPQLPPGHQLLRKVYLHTDIGLRSGKTNADGVITITGPPEAHWGIQKAGYVPACRYPGYQGDAVLCRGARVTGRVLDPSGKPLPNALVKGKHESSWAGWERTVRADEEGVYTFENLPTSGFHYCADGKVHTGTTYLHAWDTAPHSPHVASKVKVSCEAGAEIELDIGVESRPLCTICLTNAKTGKPAANVGLTCLSRTSLGESPNLSFITDSAGRVQCPVLDTPLRFNVDSGGGTSGYLLDPEWRQGRRGYSDISFDAFKTPVHRESISLLPTRKVKGKVRDVQGKPVPGALVYARYVSQWRPVPDERVRHCLTDRRGRFTFDVLPAGRPITCTAFSPNGKQVGVAEVPRGRKRVSVNVEPCRTLHGRVVDREGNPLGGLRFKWAPILSRRHGRADNGTFWWRAYVETDEDGRFCIENISPGLSYVASLGPRSGHEVPPLGDKDNITLTLRPSSRTLTVRLVDEEGNPVVSGQILNPRSRGSMPREPHCEPAGEGLFTVKNQPIGQTYLEVFTEDFNPTLVSIPADEDDVLVVLRKKAEHRYRVLNADEEPLSGVEVLIHEYEHENASSELASHTLTSGDDGLVLFSLPEGSERHTFTAEFRAPGYPLAFVTVGGKKGGPTHCSVDVILREQKPWRGRVVNRDGKAVPGAEVRVYACHYRSGTGSRCPDLGESHSDLIARTNAEGYWELPRLSQDDWIVFCVTAEGFEERREEFTPDWIDARTTVLPPLER